MSNKLSFFRIHKSVFKGKKKASAIKTNFERIIVSKRQRFVIGVIILSLGFYFSENLFARSGIYMSFVLAIATNIFLLWASYRDIRENFSLSIFILPFFYSLSFALFYFLAPGRLLTQFIVTPLYAIGLYSLFLSQNIFIVASARTIALLSGARIVSFIITLVSYFFLSTILFSLDISIIPIALMFFVVSFLLVMQNLWTITLERSIKTYSIWASILALCLVEIATVLWFWPTSSTVIAIFLTGFFYTIVGPAQIWLEKRLFRGVLWEYVWVGIIVFSILLSFTFWKGR